VCESIVDRIYPCKCLFVVRPGRQGQLPIMCWPRRKTLTVPESWLRPSSGLESPALAFTPAIVSDDPVPWFSLL
jgi:hypothetical protein